MTGTVTYNRVFCQSFLQDAMGTSQHPAECAGMHASVLGSESWLLQASLDGKASEYSQLKLKPEYQTCLSLKTK